MPAGRPLQVRVRLAVAASSETVVVAETLVPAALVTVRV